jgi:hypothetical protein
MRKLRYKFIIWQANKRLEKIFNDSMNRGIQEGLLNFGAEDVYNSLGRDKKEDWEIGELTNGTYYHNFGSE